MITLLPGTIHEIPDDMQAVLIGKQEIGEIWNNLTPLARNEWICRVTMPKQEITRIKHLDRMIQDLKKGKKRPCCRPGCPHHRASAQKWFEKK